MGDDPASVGLAEIYAVELDDRSWPMSDRCISCPPAFATTPFGPK